MRILIIMIRQSWDSFYLFNGNSFSSNLIIEMYLLLARVRLEFWVFKSVGTFAGVMASSDISKDMEHLNKKILWLPSFARSENKKRKQWKKKTSKLHVTRLCEGNSPVNSLHKGPVTRKMFPFDDVIGKIHLCIPLGDICSKEIGNQHHYCRNWSRATVDQDSLIKIETWLSGNWTMCAD